MNGAGKPSSVKRRANNHTTPANGVKVANGAMAKTASTHFSDASFMKWTVADAVHVATHHWIPCLFALGLLFFMGVEYTLFMVPPSSPPFDLGFIATRHLHAILESSPDLNTLLAALNTVFVGMQTTYILWTWLIEGRPRATISTLFMFTCRGILGYSTQLPLPQEFLGSGADFPVGNVSFFLFFSGHVAGSVIASLDMRRMQRKELAWTFDVLNVLQAVRLLGTRGHYTIDLAVGVGAGILFDSLAGKYEDSKRKGAALTTKHDFS
ncbi:phosphatidylcholine:diacylglycerol cholinephosphotransferase 1 [Vigna radiata var. radiata]|uniref:Phosphatidylcholine:diacylglycerol cholinephosphotransferase 1 n=1 Tax=Vigna radiata var. radiata TaxID=3916 RepID=A0A1S3VCG3_VIGRR|nr:phosphatidylcholine:diacylglycerol cholinephosphotransferase 1 [Vigna radiata var. radiata]